jgi:hypothetical protein
MSKMQGATAQLKSLLACYMIGKASKQTINPAKHLLTNKTTSKKLATDF